MMDQPVDRLFFALRPPPPLARQIAAESSTMAGVRALAAERLHITMFLLDDLPSLDPAAVEALRTIGSQVDAAPIEIVLDRIVASRSSAALRPPRGNAGLHALHCRIARLATLAGIAERRDYRFSPHLTLGYGKLVPRDERVAPIAWTAGELVLIHSHVGIGRHDPLGHWPLVGAPDDQPMLF